MPDPEYDLLYHPNSPIREQEDEEWSDWEEFEDDF